MFIAAARTSSFALAVISIRLAGREDVTCYRLTNGHVTGPRLENYYGAGNRETPAGPAMKNYGRIRFTAQVSDPFERVKIRARRGFPPAAHDVAYSRSWRRIRGERLLSGNTLSKMQQSALEANVFLKGGASVLAVVAIFVLAVSERPYDVFAQSGKQAPLFEVDPFWPKPLPNHWVTGSTVGLSVDQHDNVWTIHRPNTVEDNFKAADIMVGDARGRDDEALPGVPGATPPAPKPIGACCKVAPPVLVYDQAGHLVKSWGGPGQGYDWPDSNHGITVDHQGHVWLAGNGAKDTQILKFDGTGKFLFQIGTHGVHNGSNDTANFWQPTKLWEDVTAGEMYVGDGYGNRRVMVIDVATGKYKRHWGAYGNQPHDESVPAYDPKGPPSRQFNTVHCAIVSNDGFVYVCDRVNDRIQVFRRDGRFVTEAFIDPDTYRSGSVWDLAFSRDAQQTYLYAANGVDEKINILLRSTLEVLTSFGDGGRAPGQFFGVHNLATDSKGNLYATETYTGARIQRFVLKGIAPVTTKNQGVVWPKP